MAKLKVVLTKDEHGALPEAVREFYEAKGDTFVLDANVREHPEAAALVRALGEERESGKTWKQKAQAFADLGLSPEEIAELKKRHEKQEPSGDELTAKVEAEVSRRMKPIQDAAAAEKTRADTAEARARTLTIETHHRTMASKAGVRQERLERALELNRGRLGIDKDGNHIIVDAKGNPEAITPEKYWGEVFKEELPEFYQGTGSNGGGASEGGRAGAGKSIAAGDDKAFLANLDAVAKGTVAVTAR